MSLNTYSLNVVGASKQYAKISDASQTGLDGMSDLTIEGWIKPTTLSYSALVSKNSSTVEESSYSILINTDRVQVGINANALNITQTISTGTWTHVAVTYKSGTGNTKLYINGSYVNSGTHSQKSINNGNGDFAIGVYQVSAENQAFNGLIDEVRIWSTERTATEIGDNYNIELAGTETGLQGYWQFNNDYLDKTSNGNDLTAVNSPTFSTSVPFAGSDDVNTTNFFNFI